MKQINISAGYQIKSTIELAIKEAEAQSDTVEFNFNGVTVQVAADSDKDLIYRDWERGMLRKSDTFTVLPYPVKELSAEELSEDNRLKNEIKMRREAARAEYEREQALKRESLNKSLTSEIQLSDKEKWQSFVDANTDGYGAACVKYAEQWARLMQSKIEAGESLESIAEQASFDADTEGITGFMYGAAVSMLAQCWVHGEELRKWHNLETQVNREGEKANETGGVLNPAILNISA